MVMNALLGTYTEQNEMDVLSAFYVLLWIL